MNIRQIEHSATRWSISQIEQALKHFPAEEGEIAVLQAKKAHLIPPDTERCSRGVMYAVEGLRASGQITVYEEWSKPPVTGMATCFEGWVVYSTSLYFALGLLRHVTRYYGYLRCALFVEGETATGGGES